MTRARKAASWGLKRRPQLRKGGEMNSALGEGSGGGVLPEKDPG